MRSQLGSSVSNTTLNLTQFSVQNPGGESTLAGPANRPPPIERDDGQVAKSIPAPSEISWATRPRARNLDAVSRPRVFAQTVERGAREGGKIRWAPANYQIRGLGVPPDRCSGKWFPGLARAPIHNRNRALTRSKKSSGVRSISRNLRLRPVELRQVGGERQGGCRRRSFRVHFCAPLAVLSEWAGS